MFDSPLVNVEDKIQVLQIIGNPSYTLSKDKHLMFEILFREK